MLSATHGKTSVAVDEMRGRCDNPEHPFGRSYSLHLRLIFRPPASGIPPANSRSRHCILAIAGVVLAAGRSRRMGSAKALLPFRGTTFVEQILQALRDGGCDPLILVVGQSPEHDRVAELARSLGVATAINDDPESEQIDSLRIALRTLPPECQGVIVTPVDVPLVSASLVDALISVFHSSDRPLALLEHGGRHGHPTLFGRTLFDELLNPDLPDGARGVVHAHLENAALVQVNDPIVLMDVDTPEDFRRLEQR